MVGEGFEPSKLSQQIYSLPPLATRESHHISRYSDSNRKPADYKSAALPIEPRRRNGRYRARTYDPLLVRQVLSQLSYDPNY